MSGAKSSSRVIVVIQVVGAKIKNCGPHHNIGRQIRIVGEFAIRPVNRLGRAVLNERRRTVSPTVAIIDRGGVMNKSLIILTLTLLQGACATQEPVRRTANSLLGLEAISAEITVSYEMAEAADDLSRTFAMNREE